MRLSLDQLLPALKQALAPIYFVSGDEPLQSGEAADAIRRAARKAGFVNREVMTAETGFSWSELNESAASLSIFDDKKIIDLRLPSGSPGAEGSKALISYCANPNEDNLLLITAGKIDSSSTKSKWFKALDQAGCIIQVWPLDGQDLIRWLKQRTQRRGLQIGQAGIEILAARIEGNLLAAAQEIEKLYVLYGESEIGTEQLLDAVADSSRFDVFKLVDSLLNARVDRIMKILSGLRSEGIASAIVLWAIVRETRLLIKIKQSLAQGKSKADVFKANFVWEKRQPLINAALNRLNQTQLNEILILSAEADRQIKGQQAGDAWETLLCVCLKFAAL